MNASDELLRSGQVARMFGVHVNSVARWVRDGRLSSVGEPGGKNRFRPEDVAALLKEEHDERVLRQHADQEAR